MKKLLKMSWIKGNLTEKELDRALEKDKITQEEYEEIKSIPRRG
ncbi:MAG: hypothetical protein ACOCRO_06230 [Halanaerobiales bacterium]